jgi:hypothetical protein
MKKFLVVTTLIMAIMTLGSLPGTAVGAPVSLGSGTNGPGGNPTINGLKDAIDGYDNNNSNEISNTIDINMISEYAKVNWLDNDDNSSNIWETSDRLNMTGNSDTGQWELNAGDTTPIYFYALKKGPTHEFYWLNPSATSGTWTSNIGNEISNFRVYTASHVPIPGAAWLLGSGMVGLLAWP